MKGELGRSVRDIIKQICEWKRVEILADDVQVDHIHLVLSISSKHSVSESMGFLKGKSAIKIFDLYPGLKRRYWAAISGQKVIASALLTLTKNRSRIT